MELWMDMERTGRHKMCTDTRLDQAKRCRNEAPLLLMGGSVPPCDSCSRVPTALYFVLFLVLIVTSSLLLLFLTLAHIPCSDSSNTPIPRVRLGPKALSVLEAPYSSRYISQVQSRLTISPEDRT